ncbi:hypothetical protein FKR81_40445 [Lentzea tibetensis]|uniref:Fido domain-containing protein n=1 Tax=Lentzea tibetensis TaxID=2591470 RepID=A0A563EGA3_9PSEU|nr:hypothetical protein [Lentzea tibetensis]TWP44957.1 hypothetical protein FKR81_40445 [Lentzea tibetensis]
MGYETDFEYALSDDGESISTDDNEVESFDVQGVSPLGGQRTGNQVSGGRKIGEDRAFWSAMEQLAASGHPNAAAQHQKYVTRWAPIADAYENAMRDYSSVVGGDFNSVLDSYQKLINFFDEIVKDPAFPRSPVKPGETDTDTDSDIAELRQTGMLNEIDKVYDSPDEWGLGFDLASARNEIVDHSRVLPASQEIAQQAYEKAQKMLGRLLVGEVKNPDHHEDFDEVVKLARDQVYWASENLEFWNHHVSYSSDRTSQADSDSSRPASEDVADSEVKRLSDFLEEREWYRLYIHPQDHAAAREKFPDDPGKYYDQTDPGYQSGMVESYRQVLDSEDLASIELNYETYNHWHDLVNSHLATKVDATGSGQQLDANIVTAHPIRSPEVSATLLTEKVGDKQLVGTPGDNSVTWLYEGSIMSNFSADEIPGMLDSVFDRYRKEIEQAADASDKFHAIGRAVRTVQTIHPNSDTNSRLNIYLMTPALLQKNGFKPVVIQDLHTMFQGGRTLDQIARALKEGQNVDLLTDSPPTLITESLSSVQVLTKRAESISHDSDQTGLEIDFEYRSGPSSSVASLNSLNGQLDNGESWFGASLEVSSPPLDSDASNSTSVVAGAASIRSIDLKDSSVKNATGQTKLSMAPPSPVQTRTSTGPTR